MSDYTPRHGSVAQRALDWLKEQPAGARVTVGDWADGIEVESSLMPGSIKPLLDHGLVARAHEAGQPTRYTLGTAPAGDALAGMQRAVKTTPAAEAVFAGVSRQRAKARKDLRAAKAKALKTPPKRKAKAKRDTRTGAAGRAKAHAARQARTPRIQSATEVLDRIAPPLDTVSGLPAGWRYAVGSDGGLLFRHDRGDNFELPAADAAVLFAFMNRCAFAFGGQAQ